MVINFFITNMDNMKRGSPLLSHLQAKGRVDHLGGLLFALAHYWTFFKTIAWVPNYVFSSLIDNIHIMALHYYKSWLI
jgi:hypothetical protein